MSAAPFASCRRGRTGRVGSRPGADITAALNMGPIVAGTGLPVFGATSEGRWWRQGVFHRVRALELRRTSGGMSRLFAIDAVAACGARLTDPELTHEAGPRQCRRCFR